MQEPAAYCETHFSRYLDDLKTLVRIPSVSFPGFPAAEVRRSAEAVCHLMTQYGLENVELLEIPGAHPYAYGEWLKAPGKPTLLLYAHHDVQPPGRMEIWKTLPFEPTLAMGPGGQRLFGRGAADDKAGIMIHLSAIDSYLKALGQLPVNVKIVIEGEEETGSVHLAQFLKTFREKLDADVLVLTDTCNFDCGVPALTIALRGMIDIEVEVRALSKTIHSGMWGGPVPDPVMALTHILSGLIDEAGTIAVPGVLEQVKPLTDFERTEYAKIPYNEAEFREQTGMVASARLIRHPELNPLVQIWRQPSLTINAIQASSRAQAGNIINDIAWAKITVRLVDGMDPDLVRIQVQEFLKSRVPWGLECKFDGSRGSPPWAIDPQGPAFEAASVAMEKGYGKVPYKIGSGGSIPFVKPFADALGGAPALLIGVEDPYTNAHGENESLLISDLYKSCLSQIYLFAELAERMKKPS